MKRLIPLSMLTLLLVLALTGIGVPGSGVQFVGAAGPTTSQAVAPRLAAAAPVPAVPSIIVNLTQVGS